MNNENPSKNLSGNPCENSNVFKSQQGQLSQAGNTDDNTADDSEDKTIISLCSIESRLESPLVLTTNENISNNESNNGKGNTTANKPILLEPDLKQRPIDEAQD